MLPELEALTRLRAGSMLPDLDRPAMQRRRWRNPVRRLCAAGIILAVTPALAASPMSAFLGAWAPSAKACIDQDGVERLAIASTRLDWYETHCPIHNVTKEGPGVRLELACHGEGLRFGARPRLRLQGANQLVMTESPVGPGKRQTYVRCRR